MKRFFRWLGAFVVVAVLVAAAAFGYAYWKFTKPGPLAETTIVLIERGSSLADIAERLYEKEVIGDRLVFRAWVRIYGDQNRLRAGEFEFPARISQKGAMRLIIEGRMVLRRFSAPEGHTSYQIVQALRETPGLTGEITKMPEEGSLLPDTYFFVYGDTRDHMIARMRRALDEVLDKAWEARQPDLPLKNRREALILASIIEKETSKSEERRKVASVFINRMRRGMRLQTDPTVIYGITEGKGPLGRRLLYRDLRTPHPYNTYVIPGLPPGPIANPGRGAIEAAVDPEETRLFYFVADGTGGHAFAETLAEHQRNVARWRKIRREQERN